MSHSMLPFPGRHESHDHWMRRCDEWESNRRRSNSSGLSGRPNKSGTVIEEFEHTRKNGETVTAVRIGYGAKASNGVKRYAEKHGLGFEEFVGNGCHGKCARYDGVAFFKTA